MSHNWMPYNCNIRSGIKLPRYALLSYCNPHNSLKVFCACQDKMSSLVSSSLSQNSHVLSSELFQLFTSYYSGFRWEGKHICLWKERFQKAFEWNSISQKSSDLIGALCVRVSFLAFKYHAGECHACYFHASDATKLFMVVLPVPWYTRQNTQIQLIRPPS